MADILKNFAYSNVAVAPSPADSGTSLDVTAGHGTRFPTPPFNLVVWPANQIPLVTNAEIVRVTNISTDTLTITRTQETTSARSIQVGDQVAQNITALMLDDKVSKVTSTDNAVVRFDSTSGAVQNSGITVDDSNNVTLPSGSKLYLSQSAVGSMIELTSSASTGGLSGIKFYMSTDYDRNWLGWYDNADRLRVMLGYHDKDYNSSESHYRYEIKTSDDPAGGSPANMATRFIIGTDAADVAASFNVSSLNLDTYMNDGTTARTSVSFIANRQTVAATAGMHLLVQAGGATSGATDKAGGDLKLSSGISTGNARAGIQFFAARQGSSGTTDNTPAQVAYLANSGSSANSMIMSIHNSTSFTGTPFANSFVISGQNAGGFGAYRQATANTAGNNVTVQASGATSGATDKNGGNLILSSGIATGTGTSQIDLKVYPAGTTGTADNTQTTIASVKEKGVDFVKSAYFSSEIDNGNSGTADTIDWGAGNKQKSTNNGNVTYTMTNPPGPCNIVFKIIHDATASTYTRAFTPSSGAWYWAGGVAPTWTQIANAIDIVSAYFDGTNWYAAANTNFA